MTARKPADEGPNLIINESDEESESYLEDDALSSPPFLEAGKRAA